ncbi:MAG TPA: hypothetical protein VL125_01190 [Pelobium sp.]|nr:hypothetical protein [Pelobium sp.]
MKISFLLILAFIGSSFIEVKANVVDLTDSISGVKIENQQILYRKSVLGKVKVLSDGAKTQNSKLYNVQIFGRKGRLVAEYEVEVLSKHKKNHDAILNAQIKTVKDNVIHNGTNFIDFHLKPSADSKDAVLQLDKVVKYLLNYKYL